MAGVDSGIYAKLKCNTRTRGMTAGQLRVCFITHLGGKRVEGLWWEESRWNRVLLWIAFVEYMQCVCVFVAE